VGTAVRVTDVSLPAKSIAARAGEEDAWLRQATKLLQQVELLARVHACVAGPERPRPRSAAVDARILSELRARGEALGDRLTLRPATQWAIRVSLSGCDATPGGDGE
jgi:hypothetical protein